MDISVIIVNYNVKEYIISCIESIIKHTDDKYKFEIIVIDNNSKDGSCDEVEKTFNKIKIIKNKYNFGYSFAVNQGARIAKGNYMLILNPDTLFIEDSLSKLISEAKTLDKLGAIGPKLVCGDGKFIQSFWKKPTLLSTMLGLFHLDFLNSQKNYKSKVFSNVSRVETLSGGAMFMERTLFNNLNGLNENLFWMEDIDLCVRLEEKGYHVFYLPSTSIIHFMGKSSKKNYEVAISNQILSKIKYFNIHHKPFALSIIYFSALIAILMKIILFLFFSIFSKSARIKLSAYYSTLVKILKVKH